MNLKNSVLSSISSIPIQIINTIAPSIIVKINPTNNPLQSAVFKARFLTFPTAISYFLSSKNSFVYAFNPFHYDIKLFEKAVDKLEGRNNLILIWMNINLNDKLIQILLKKSKKFESGINIYPYIIVYF